MTAGSLHRLLPLSIALIALLAVRARAQVVVETGRAPADGVDLRYRVLGTGRPLLVVNGGPGWSSDHMLPVAERLAGSWRVILFDQRGTGGSALEVADSTTVTMSAMVEDMEALRRHLGIERWVVFGHSFGGMLALAYAAAHPERVAALVLSAPAGPTLDFLDYYPASLEDRMLPAERETVALWSDSARMAAEPRKAAYEIVRASMGAFLYDRSRLGEARAIVDEDTWSPATSALVWWDLARTGFDVREPLRGFDRPVLVVQGRQDALGDLHAWRVAELFPRSTFRILERSAHLMWVDRPDAYYETVLGFLDRLP